MIKRIQGSPKILTVHGDRESCNTFAQEIHEKFGLEALAANVNENFPV